MFRRLTTLAALTFLLFVPVIAGAQSSIQHVVMETFTGTWCGFCPDGRLVRDDTVALSARVIAIDIHDFDALTNVDGEMLTTAYSPAFPQANFNRSDLLVSRGSWEATANALLLGVASVDVSVVGGINTATRVVSGTINASFTGPVAGDLRFGLLVTEDNVVGPGFDQVNFSNAVPGHPYEGAGDPIVGYDHRYVLRSAPLGPWGTAGVIAAAVDLGDEFSTPFSFVLDPSIDENEVTLVGLVALYDAPVASRVILNANTAVPEIDPPAPLAHFMNYKVKTAKGTAKPPKFGPVSLDGALANTDFLVLKPSGLLLPADKNGEGLVDSTTHLEAYKIKIAPAAESFTELLDVQVDNQCHSTTIEIGVARSVLVPTSKDLAAPTVAPDPSAHDVDHFVCHKAKSDKLPKGTQVEVVDQFESRRYDLVKVAKFCTPVDKSGTPVILSGPLKLTPKPLEPAVIGTPDAHLLCYKAKLAKKEIVQDGCGALDPTDKGTVIDPKPAKHTPRLGVYVANQFWQDQLDTIKVVEFCIPTTAVLP
jgi:hypothetical protein